MRYVDDRDSTLLQPANNGEQALRLVVGKRGGRIVHHPDAGVLRQCCCDLDDLLMGNAEFMQGPAWIDVRAQQGQYTLCVLQRLLNIDRARYPASRLPPQKDVLRHT